MNLTRDILKAFLALGWEFQHHKFQKYIYPARVLPGGEGDVIKNFQFDW